jgi:MoaA/NifB/PqqE/SkfB family radical SAM enzyme
MHAGVQALSRRSHAESTSSGTNPDREYGTAVPDSLHLATPCHTLILTGGDPLSRKDLFRVIDDARALGLPVSITPSATPALTAEALGLLHSHGIQSLGLSLDGSNASRHDAVRAIPGCFDRRIDVAGEAGQLRLPIQVNTLVAQETADDLSAIYELLKTFPSS